MKVLFAIKRLERQSGGSERVLVHVVNALVRRGHEMMVLTWDAPGTQPFYRLDPAVRLINRGVGDSARPTRPLEIAKRMADLRRSIVAAKPDIVVGFGHSMFVPLALGLVGTGIAMIASEHAVRTHYRQRPLHYALLRVAARLAKCITVTTGTVGADYTTDVQRRMIIMPNPIMIADLALPQRASRLVLNVGRLDPEKDQVTMIRAFGRVAPRFPEWGLRILGEGRLRPELEQLVERLGLGDRIDMPGITNDIVSAYAGADVFALSSSYESFGLAALEAMSQELPVLGFADCPGINELIADEQGGLLVPSGDDRVTAFAEGLARMMSDHALRLRLGLAGRRRAEALAAKDDAIERWEHLLLATLTGGEIAQCVA